jgi:hypothetical protein
MAETSLTRAQKDRRAILVYWARADSHQMGPRLDEIGTGYLRRLVFVMATYGPTITQTVSFNRRSR